MDPGPIPLLSMSIYLVTIGRNQFESAIKPARVDLDTLFTDYTAIYFRFSSLVDSSYGSVINSS
jgi:hypothetical protein